MVPFWPKTKFRVLQRDFAELSNGKKVIEYEEVVVGSNTMSFDEYIELRILAFIIFVTNQGIVFDAILKFLREQKIDVFDLYYQMFTNRKNAPNKTQEVIEHTVKYNQIQPTYKSFEQTINIT